MKPSFASPVILIITDALLMANKRAAPTAVAGVPLADEYVVRQFAQTARLDTATNAGATSPRISLVACALVACSDLHRRKELRRQSPDRLPAAQPRRVARRARPPRASACSASASKAGGGDSGRAEGSFRPGWLHPHR